MEVRPRPHKTEVIHRQILSGFLLICILIQKKNWILKRETHRASYNYVFLFPLLSRDYARKLRFPLKNPQTRCAINAPTKSTHAPGPLLSLFSYGR